MMANLREQTVHMQYAAHYCENKHTCGQKVSVKMFCYVKANCIHDLTCYLHVGYVQSRCFAAIYIEHKHIF